MRFYASIGSANEESFRREIRFEERKDGLYVHLRRSEEDYQEDHVFRLDGDERGQGSELHLLLDGAGYDLCLGKRRGGCTVLIGSEHFEVEVVDEREFLARSITNAGPKGPQELRAEMPGIVVSLDCEPGQEVSEGQTLLVLEAMKMQNPISAETSGKVLHLHVEAGQAVTAGDLLLTLE